MYKALEVIVTGKIQGVGFRPFIYSLAKKYNLTGTVQNNFDCVIIVVEGQSQKVNQMVEELKVSPPSLSKITEMIFKEIPPVHYEDFKIIESRVKRNSVPWITGDAAICKECLDEMKNPQNRRFQYPFTNCTQCGPRYTIIENLPYDRPKTTMKKFQMCLTCKEEYEDPSNRRHHAQPICCSECGPVLKLLNQQGEELACNNLAISQAADLLKEGKIIAIKGLGGYHLACNSYQEATIERLRKKKNRPQRPFAIMVKSLNVAEKICYVSRSERELLTSSEMPIVVLQKKRVCELPENLSPGLSTLGVMLPYTPLHHLLFENADLDCLVMTSANPSGLPLQYKDHFSDQFMGLCDYILYHDRQIYTPIDDSVVQCYEDKFLFLRKARGYVPEPITTTSKVDNIIAFGANQKNAFAIGKRNQIMMSPHIGDLESEEMVQSYFEQLEHFIDWLGVDEKYTAVDKHPLYVSNSISKKLKSKVIPVQHHHAHHVSCMEDNELQEPCLGIILDGTGYGEDGHIWGFEFLYGNAKSYKRLGHLQYTPIPGGDKSVKEPWRNAVGMLLHYWPEEGKELAEKLFPGKTKEIRMLEFMIKNNINTPLAGTCGRIFDAVSAILGICLTSTYEGEAAIKLGDYINLKKLENTDDTYSFRLYSDGNQQLIDLSQMIYQIIQDRFSQQPLTKIVQRFHQTIVSCCVKMILTLKKNNQEFNKTVMLSGGSFQNIFLIREIQNRLQKEGFKVYTHKRVPCHDGGLSLGQIIIASNAVTNNEGGEIFVSRSSC